MSRPVDQQAADLEVIFGYTNRSDVIEACVATVWGAFNAPIIKASFEVYDAKKVTKGNQITIRAGLL